MSYSVETTGSNEAGVYLLTRSADGVTVTCRFNSCECGLSSVEDALTHIVEFQFDESYLQGFSVPEHDFGVAAFPTFYEHECCCNTQMILYDVVTCKLQGVLRNMFMESKALALLLCFQKCYATAQPSCDGCKFLTKPLEKEKILAAKEILLSKLHEPPTIPELSLLVGINQCYLKKGFKEMFGCTVYDFIQEQRMSKAKWLLATTSHSVSEVAERIGFSSVSNFSSAFKKHTGVLPSELRRG